VKVILFGATGMVGRGVLRECLRDDGVETVLAIGRHPTGQTHPKLHELVREDLFEFDSADAELRGYDACFFCLGVSSVGMSESEYTHVTFELTIGWARTLARIDRGVTFVYVSGAGTGGKAMWAQVKGRTEDALLSLFPSAYMIRLGVLRPMHGEAPNSNWIRVAYVALRPILALLAVVVPGAVITTEQLGRAMIRMARERPPKRILAMRDLIALGAS